MGNMGENVGNRGGKVWNIIEIEKTKKFIKSNSLILLKLQKQKKSKTKIRIVIKYQYLFYEIRNIKPS